jgi:hypothetical protein
MTLYSMGLDRSALASSQLRRATVAFCGEQAGAFPGNHPGGTATPATAVFSKSRLVVLFRPNLPEIDTRLSVQG